MIERRQRSEPVPSDRDGELLEGLAVHGVGEVGAVFVDDVEEAAAVAVATVERLDSDVLASF